jgi:hypothetical protein
MQRRLADQIGATASLQEISTRLIPSAFWGLVDRSVHHEMSLARTAVTSLGAVLFEFRKCLAVFTTYNILAEVTAAMARQVGAGQAVCSRLGKTVIEVLHLLAQHHVTVKWPCPPLAQVRVPRGAARQPRACMGLARVLARLLPRPLSPVCGVRRQLLRRLCPSPMSDQGLQLLYLRIVRTNANIVAET